MLKMVTPLLEDHFQLKFHHETRELPGFALIVAKGGPKMKAYDAVEAKGRSWGMTAPDAHLTQITGWDVNMSMLTNILSSNLGVPVGDATGLPGRFQFTLRYATYDAPVDPAQAAVPADPGPGSVFAALQEQLGLKLDRRQVPVEIVVIDHAEKPEPN